MAITDYDGVREVSTINETQQPKEAPMQTTTQPTQMTQQESIARSVALKAAVDIEVAKLNNKMVDGSNSMEDIVTNADNLLGYLIQ
jgi:hypothetical protein